MFGKPGRPAPLRGADRPLARLFDVALMDLDGVVYRGARAIPHAGASIDVAAGLGMRTVYVTNNALRPPEDVAARLTGFGVPAEPSDVITSAQAAAHVLAGRLPPGARVLVVGGAGLRQAVVAEGLTPVTSAEDHPAAVVQGFDPEMTYARLVEATLAVRAGALWVASNTDTTVPTERGLAPGNGALVAAVRAATGAEPIVTGKPERAMHAESIRRSGARHPIIIGDRLDTDVEAGVRAGAPTLLVLTGVTGPSELLAASAHHRPTFVSADLRGLLRAHPEPGPSGDGWRCGGWLCVVDDGVLSWHRVTSGANGGAGSGGSTVSVAPADDGLDALRAGCAAAWAAVDRGIEVTELAEDRPPECADLKPPVCRGEPKDDRPPAGRAPVRGSAIEGEPVGSS